jgi:hypothetical protein
MMAMDAAAKAPPMIAAQDTAEMGDSTVSYNPAGEDTPEAAVRTVGMSVPQKRKNDDDRDGHPEQPK